MVDIVLIFALFLASMGDCKKRIIPNRLTIPLLAFGIIYNLIFGGLSGLSDSLLGALIGLMVFIIPFAAGGMGAGDVKLMAAIGAVKGALFIAHATLAAAVIGAIVSLIVLAYHGRLKALVLHILRYVMPSLPPSSHVVAEKIYIPYGVAIAVGAAAILVRNGLLSI